MGTTIGNLLISYDVNKSYSQVKADMEKLGYHDHFKNTNDPKTYVLPNTTLWHPKKSSDQALINLKTTCKSLQAIIEKAVAINASEFVGL
ncbi:hypothetical protein SAMN05421820_101872 [Pedobacter steynii]|uniref:Uncharacterized protein n=1 Tax=Pedobacter steynii TaxID=430522 RepID=A0A1G9LFM5_9SPHI|nr:hypothetical protein [Pedobacter steynii]NQX38833.1 hypothetical protein [Pedobacter steynii]SDL60696.1 hypothetical protein SAMN05421820_101872 [Pedobacter steynii]